MGIGRREAAPWVDHDEGEYPPSQPAWITVPAAAARTGVPCATEMSILVYAPPARTVTG